MNKYLKPLWQYRDFILASVARDFQLKHRNSILGSVWSILNPLSMIVIYTVIFSQIMKAKLPGVESMYGYSVYLCSGIIFWGLFAEMMTRFQTLFIDNANVLKKLNFPRLTLPIITVFSSLLNVSIIIGIFFVFLLLTGQFPDYTILAVIPVLLVQLIFTVGLGMSLSVLNVFFRDIGQLFTIIVQFWFWLTPIVYPITILPKVIQKIVLTWNPIAPLMNAYQTIFVYGTMPEWDELLTPLLAGLLLCFFGLKLYVKHSADIVDEL